MERAVAPAPVASVVPLSYPGGHLAAPVTSAFRRRIGGFILMAFPEIPGYEILDEIGRGGMGVVYRARHIALDRIVALKVLHAALCDDAEFVKSFAQEAKIIARLHHPNIVSVYDFGQHEDLYYLSMQFAQGKTVRDVMNDRKLSLEECSQILTQVADALDYAHRSEVIHRDIKPGNIMLCYDGKAMVMDFGVASATYGSGPGSVWVSAGSPSYMSPEQCSGRGAGPRSDQYSLGITIYEMITGRLPFTENDPVAAMRQQIHDPPPPLRTGRLDITERVEAAVMRALSKMPEMRYHTLGDFARELDAAVRQAPVMSAPVAVPAGAAAGPAVGRAPVSLVDGAPPAPGPRSSLPGGYVYTSRPQSQAPWLKIALVLAALIVIGGAVYFVSRSRPTVPAEDSGSRSHTGSSATKPKR